MTQKNKSVGFGIVGCGNIGAVHAEVISQLPQARLVAVSSRTVASAKRLGHKHKVPVYGDYNEMFARPEVDVVSLCTPSGARAEIAEAAARAGKHIVSEKPLEVSLERVDRITKACDMHHVKLAAIFPVRFFRSTQRVRQAVEAGRLGKPVLGDAYVKWYRTQEYYEAGGWRGTWKLDGGGALMNQSIHYVDQLQWMFGPVEQVFAQTTTLMHPGLEVEDTAVAVLKFINGALGVIEGTTSISPGFPARMELHGEKGTIAWQEGQIITWKLADATPVEEAQMLAIGRKVDATGSQDPTAFNREGHNIQLADMADAILEDREPSVNGYEGRKAVELVLAIYRSANTGRPVKLPLTT
jgi:UDP-N-acetyl-2-amino-2-deoxyglucuronate dehydrogenase